MLVVCFGQRVVDVYRPTLGSGPAGVGTGAQSDGSTFPVVGGFRRGAEGGSQPEELAVEPEDEAMPGPAQTRGVLDQGLQDRLKIERRAADDLEDFAGRGLLLQ